MICCYCKRDMFDPQTKSCEDVGVKFPDDKKVTRAIAHQDDHGRRCGDCNVKTGGFHHPGCPRERCPRCWGYLASCNCLAMD